MEHVDEVVSRPTPQASWTSLGSTRRDIEQSWRLMKKRHNAQLNFLNLSLIALYNACSLTQFNT